MKKYSYRGCYTIVIYPFLIAIVLSVYLIRGLWMSHSNYSLQLLTIIVLVCAIWLVGWLRSRKNADISTSDNPVLERIKAAIPYVLFFCLGVYFSSNVWGIDGGLTLFPVERIDNGSSILLDTLWNASLAAGFRGGLLPISLQNSPHVIHYHTLSHFLMRIISEIVNLPVYLCYNYLYPVIFIPIYVFSQVFAISEAKNFFTNSRVISISDTLLISYFNLDILDGVTLNRMGIQKTVYYWSESYLIAITLFFLFCGISFKVLKSGKWIKAYMCFCVPIFIFLCTWSKIAVGPFLAFVVMWYVFKKGFTDHKCWLLLPVYGAILLLALYQFRYDVGSSNVSSHLELVFGAYAAWCKSPVWYIGHLLYLSVLPALFLVLSRMNNKKRTVWEEEVQLFTLFGLLPSMFLYTFDTKYFSLLVPIPALILLCGCGYVDGLIKKCSEKNKQICSICIIALSFFFVLQTKRSVPHPFQQAEAFLNATRKSDSFEQCMMLRDLAGGEVEEYAIFLEPRVSMQEIYDSDASVILTYTGLTGMEVINASYEEQGIHYYYSGEPVGGQRSANLIETANNNGRLSLEDAKAEAKRQGFHHLIHIDENGYDEIDL